MVFVFSQRLKRPELKNSSSSDVKHAEDSRLFNSKVHFKKTDILPFAWRYLLIMIHRDFQMIDVDSGFEVKSGEVAERWVDEYEAAISGDEYDWLNEYTEVLLLVWFKAWWTLNFF